MKDDGPYAPAPKRRPLHALTLHRPWPWAIFHAGKAIENRSWKPPDWLRGQRLAIHAGAKWDEGGAFDIEDVTGMDPPPEAEEVGVIGTVRVDGCISGLFTTDPPEYRDWFVGPFGWMLSDPRLLPEPIVIPGRQGLWPVPADALAKINEALR